MIKRAIEYLNQKYGYELNSNYYENINVWLNWWKGLHEPFHNYRELGYDKRVIKREMYTLKMAKKVCEDWASLLINERTSITLDNESANSIINEVFSNNAFWKNANALIEKAFALGTGAFALRLDGDEIIIDYINADCIIPISYNNRDITEIAFASVKNRKGKKYIYLECHLLNEKGNYVIYNECFNEDFTAAPLLDDIVSEYDTKSSVPWFSVITPNIVNSIDLNTSLGISVFHNAIDVLKGIDLAYNNFCRDFKLGGKKVFLDKSLVDENNGQSITPDDVAQQLFVMVGDENVTSSERALVQEHNPELRVGENSEGIQAQLNYLSSKCGLGERYYSFNQGSVATATQVISENSALFRNIKKHEIVIEKALIGLVKGILSIAKCDVDTEISIMFDDSIIEDKAAERSRDLQDIAAGIMNKIEYRVKWYGETEDEAKLHLPDMQNLLEDE